MSNHNRGRHDNRHGHRHGHRHDNRHQHGREYHPAIERTYQEKIIETRIDPDGIRLVPAPVAAKAPAAKALAAKAPPTPIPDYTIEFTPTEDALNAAKDALGEIGTGNDSGKSKEYMIARRAMDMYADTRREVLRLGGEKNASNAFLKYWELAYEYYPRLEDALLGDDGASAPANASASANTSTITEIRAFFNAELPGSSMVAFNHYMRTLHPEVDYVWRASSLWSPDMVEGSYGLEDQYGYFRNNRDKWMMSDNNNGDMTTVANILDVAARLGPNSEFGGVHVYSHDAGINVSGEWGGEARYDVQEESNMWLHLGCAIAGLLTLRKGGMFIAKQYTLYRTFTWNLIILYATMFDNFYLTKPVTSRPTNSEIYLVGVGFRGAPQSVIDMLIGRLQSRDSSPLYAQADVRLHPVISSLQKFVLAVHGQQHDMMLEMVRLYRTYTPAEISAGSYQLKRALIHRWLTRYPVPRISAEDRVPSN